MSIVQPVGRGSRKPRGGRPVPWILDLFSNVWLGIVWAVLLFIYCSIGSALPGVRTLPALEMTEFEWFNWWPFSVLMILLCLTLTVTTVRRIPLRTVNLGVWMIHTGIIVLCAGSYYYFGTKVEGDAPVFRRRVRVELPKLAEPTSFPTLPGAGVTVDAGPDRWLFQVQSSNSAWPILSAEHEGEHAYAVNVLVTPPAGEPFIRQLLAGYPQYTEDVIPGKGRAVKLTGEKLIKPDLKLSLDYEPQSYFHVMDTWALYVRRVGERDWVQRPIEGLPRYNENVGSRDQVFTETGYSLPLRSLDLTVAPAAEGDALGATPVHVTGYLPYAFMKRRWRGGGDRLNPVAAVSLYSDDTAPQSYELVAFDRNHRVSQDGMVELRWFDEFAGGSSLPADARAALHVEVPAGGFDADIPITPESLVGRGGDFTPISGTDFAYRILNVQDNLVMPGRNRAVSVAMVEIKTPEATFTRMVADQPQMTRDMRGDNPDPHSPAARTPQAADARIAMTYRPRSSPIIFAAHPGGVFLVVNGPKGRLLGREVRVGELVEIIPGLSVRADGVWPRPIADTKPSIVPRASRQKGAAETFAMIRLEVGEGASAEQRWVRFNSYALPGREYAYAGRFSYAPEQFRLADGSRVEVLFSRERRELPSPIALEAFTLETHVGGYTGQALTIRNFVSELRFLDDGRWSDPEQIVVNAPTEHGGYWYFQSMWDKPSSSDPGGGMNYTGLGVGNRNGVHVQLAGCCLAVVGMLFAFYVKPVLRRRRREQSRAKISGSADGPSDRSPPPVEQQAVRV